MERLEDRITPTGPGITTLASFSGPVVQAAGGLVADSSGNLYGTVTEPQLSFGIYEVVKGSGTATTLASMDIGLARPVGTPVMDSSGNLYGTTQEPTGSLGLGGGIIYELPKGSHSITTLASFSSTMGYTPNAGLVMDKLGNLYGVTLGGGGSGDGTIFELAKGSSTIATLASFNGTNGKGPNSLLVDSNGDLYGTTAQSGGTIFELAKGSSTIATLASFGALPVDLIRDNSGNLYGTTAPSAGVSGGTIFELANGSNTIATLASFSNASGVFPNGSVVIDSSGNLYGTAASINDSPPGTVFGLAKGSGTITTLASFNAATTGEGPDGLILDSSGNLYGTTLGGGAGSAGTVFEVTRPLPTLAVTDAGGTYNGSAFPASYTINGGNSLEGVTPTLSYYVGTYTSAAQLSGLTALSGAPTLPGSYTALASFIGSIDYSSASAVANFTIKPPASNVYTYDSQHRLTQVVYTNGNVYTRTYAQDGSSTAMLFNTSGTVGGGVSYDTYA